MSSKDLLKCKKYFSASSQMVSINVGDFLYVLNRPQFSSKPFRPIAPWSIAHVPENIRTTDLRSRWTDV